MNPSRKGYPSDNDSTGNSATTTAELLREDCAFISSDKKVVDITCTNSSSFSNLVNVNKWLAYRLIGDVGVATGVTFGVAPILTVIDKAIVQRTAGTYTLLASAKETMRYIVREPIAYLRSPTFLLMWGVYAATYSTANGLKTLVEHNSLKNDTIVKRNSNMKMQEKQEDQHGNSSFVSPAWGAMGVFLGTTTVSSGASLLKDRAYARMYGLAASTAGTGAMPKIPLATLGLWFGRDLLVIGSGFILPDMMADAMSVIRIERNGGVDIEQQVKDTDRKMCQLICPVMTQVIAGPLHFLGLDLVNRPLSRYGNGTFASWRMAFLDRMRYLRSGYVSIVSARMMRIAPGYGVGGIFNTRYRDQWRDYVQRRQDLETMEQKTVMTLQIPSSGGSMNLSKIPKNEG